MVVALVALLSAAPARLATRKFVSPYAACAVDEWEERQSD
jgi:hypothetical protein